MMKNDEDSIPKAENNSQHLRTMTNKKKTSVNLPTAMAHPNSITSCTAAAMAYTLPKSLNQSSMDPTSRITKQQLQPWQTPAALWQR
jgi:hypothetical protein